MQSGWTFRRKQVGVHSATSTPFNSESLHFGYIRKLNVGYLSRYYRTHLLYTEHLELAMEC